MFQTLGCISTRQNFFVAALLLIGTATASAQSASADKEQPLVRRDVARLTLAGAQRVIAAAQIQAEQMGVQSNIAVVDDGGHLLAFARMDGARPSSIYTAITKAVSAATHRQPTGPLGGDQLSGVHLSLALENAATASGGKFTTLRGGIPIVLDDQVIGAIGVGGATGEQDAEVAAAGIAAVTQSLTDADQSVQGPPTTKENTVFGNWVIVDIDGHGVVELAEPTLEIAADGSVSGNTSVNRYFGKATIAGDQIQFGKMGATRRAGPPALMDQEQQFLNALGKVTRYKIDDKDLLHLFDGDWNELLRASKYVTR
ncbi:heme-binding protein [Allorhodopirellula heiligendammensis]|uniref:DUF306 domain-containing protein n=1 Tax=Allorhodopirellula heiligendammensis TaxID=2714739 RepID=A0A5C6BE36_9BACT|nr:heme-binding protein [Allorhodopirellula heiligendammensis]TWU10455.1 hypothetical protein Poly21_43590 [Allorhodopirellula heiligendammensis]